MTQRQIDHRGHSWEVSHLGWGTGAGRRATNFPVRFRRTSAQPEWSFEGEVFDDDLTKVPEDQLRRQLDRAMVQDAINRSDFDWRTAEALSRELSMSVDEVRAILEAMPDLIYKSITPHRSGRALYTTRDKYKRVRGFLGRYLDVLNQSSS